VNRKYQHSVEWFPDVGGQQLERENGVPGGIRRVVPIHRSLLKGLVGSTKKAVVKR
jgi:hypothetical protein